MPRRVRHRRHIASLPSRYALDPSRCSARMDNEDLLRPASRDEVVQTLFLPFDLALDKNGSAAARRQDISFMLATYSHVNGALEGCFKFFGKLAIAFVSGL
jgi:hypothetical protein